MSRASELRRAVVALVAAVSTSSATVRLCCLVAGTAGCGDATATRDETAPASPAGTVASPSTSGGEEGPSGSAPRTGSTAPAPATSDIPRPAAPVVDLGGVANLPGPLSSDRPAVGATGWLVRVRGAPRPEAEVIGYLRGGATVATKPGVTSGATADCADGWQAIEPVGWVCMSDATRDLQHPIVRAAAQRPDFGHKLPYMYGTVTRGGPVYARIPTPADLERHEPNLRRHLDKWRDDEVSGARYGLDVWLRYASGRDVPSALEALAGEVSDDDADLPFFLRGDGRSPDLSGLVDDVGPDVAKIDQVDRRQGRSFVASFLRRGRRYNVTPDLVVIPADRFRPIRGSDFHGWDLRTDENLAFPFALMRRTGKKWQWDGKRMKDAGTQPWREALPLTGKRQIYRRRLYYETKAGFYVDDRHASEVVPARRWPKWAKQGGKWIDINLTQQILKAYEGKKMVYVTIISSGEAGLADPEDSTATIRGIYRIHTKYVTTTMDSDAVGEAFELRDVPYVQYFKDGYALHGAYWHDGFGRPKSHGCINLAPEDARRLFFWTDPPVPPRWHGARKSLTGTVVFVHE
ncbi:MAG: L,D-transpeptidase family protein [Myxococcota bacterium]